MRASPQRKGEGVKATRAVADVHSTSPAGGTTGGGGCPAGTLVGAGACGSASPVGSERVKPNDGVGLRRTTVRRAEEAQTSMRRVATERDAPATRSGQSAASSFEFRIALV